MKKYLILFLMVLGSVATNAQNCYFNLRFGSEKELSTAKFTNSNIGIQLGIFVTDGLALELDYINGWEDNFMRHYSIGGNVVYHFSNYYKEEVVPYVKIGSGYKKYITDLGYSSGTNIKYGVGINVLLNNFLSLNLGINLQHFLNNNEGGWEENIPTHSCETEIGICFAF